MTRRRSKAIRRKPSIVDVSNLTDSNRCRKRRQTRNRNPDECNSLTKQPENACIQINPGEPWPLISWITNKIPRFVNPAILKKSAAVECVVEQSDGCMLRYKEARCAQAIYQSFKH